MLAPETAAAVEGLAAEAGRVADAVREQLEMNVPGAATPSTAAMADAASRFTFPDDVWVRVIYDLVVAARDQPDRLDGFVAALVPVYFGRVASFVVENRDLPTDRAEDQVERQAREFERLKPYLVERWDAAAVHAGASSRQAAAAGAAAAGAGARAGAVSRAGTGG
jgi:hypothetical protein